MTLESEDREITVESSNVPLGDRLPEYARESIRKVTAKFFGRLSTASVHFTKGGAVGVSLAVSSNSALGCHTLCTCRYTLRQNGT
jgi:hypothetical protein